MQSIPRALSPLSLRLMTEWPWNILKPLRQQGWLVGEINPKGVNCYCCYFMFGEGWWRVLQWMGTHTITYLYIHKYTHMYSKHSYISICMRVAMCCYIYTSYTSYIYITYVYIYTVHSIHHMYIYICLYNIYIYTYYQCFNRLRHNIYKKPSWNRQELVFLAHWVPALPSTCFGVIHRTQVTKKRAPWWWNCYVGLYL